MVSELIKYTCDICNKVCDTLEEANECESSGYTEHPIFNIGECYNFVTAMNQGSWGEPDYEGIETIKIVGIDESHKVKYICEVYDEVEEEWYMKNYIIEGNDYFKYWNRGKVDFIK